MINFAEKYRILLHRIFQLSFQPGCQRLRWKPAAEADIAADFQVHDHGHHGRMQAGGAARASLRRKLSSSARHITLSEARSQLYRRRS